MNAYTYKKIGILSLIGFVLLSTKVFATTGKVYNASNGLVLRGSAAKSGAPLATIAEGSEIEILETSGEWYKVNADGKEGYLYAEYVKVEEEPETEETAQTTNIDKEKNIKKIYILPVITSTTIGEINESDEMKVEKTVGNWDYITYNSLKGWIRSNNSITLKEEELPEELPEEEKEGEEPKEQETKEEEEEQKEEETTQQHEDTNVSFRKGYINSASVNVRQEPSTSSEIVTTLILNTGITITAQTGDWYRVVYGDYMGYIYKPLISENPTPTSRSSEPRNSEKEENAQEVQPEQEQNVETTVSSESGENVVSFAKQYLGYSYTYGGTTPSGGFDCSGFVYYVFNSCGYNISRSCLSQAQSGTAVAKSELKPGDILFFNNNSDGSIGHTGIYIGDGRFIHAANPSRGVVTDTINSGYYYTYYYSARRVAE